MMENDGRYQNTADGHFSGSTEDNGASTSFVLVFLQWLAWDNLVCDGASPGTNVN